MLQKAVSDGVPRGGESVVARTHHLTEMKSAWPDAKGLTLMRSSGLLCLHPGAFLFQILCRAQCDFYNEAKRLLFLMIKKEKWPGCGDGPGLGTRSTGPAHAFTRYSGTQIKSLHLFESQFPTKCR